MPEHDELMAALTAADPIDEHEVSAAWSASPLRMQLLEEIEMSTTQTTPDQRTAGSPARWRVARIGAAAAVLALAVVLLPTPFGPQTSAYAIRPLPDGRIEVTVADLDNADALAADLREFGVDITVRPEVASPSQVGRVTGTEGLGVDEDGVMPTGMTVSPDGEEFRFAVDPDTYTGSLTMYVGVPPEAGQDYTVAASAFDQGEVLAGWHCRNARRLTADALAQTTRQLGISVDWTVITQVTPDATGYVSSSVEVPDQPEGRVVSAYMRNPDTLRAEVVPFELPDGEVVQLTDPAAACAN